MNHIFELKTYNDVEDFIADVSMRHCFKCHRSRYHLRCGFKGNNERFECLACGGEQE